jgi:hypothetical protein
MELVVDLSTASVVLMHRDDVERFSVRALSTKPGDGDENGALGALAAALSVHGAGTVDPGGHVFVPAETVKRLAAEAATAEGQSLDPEWESNFVTMLAAAGTQGWIADDGALRAHVEWGG